MSVDGVVLEDAKGDCASPEVIHPQIARRSLSSRILGSKGATEAPQRSSSAPNRSSSSLSNRIIGTLGGSKGKLEGYALNVTEDAYDDDDDEEEDTLEVPTAGVEQA